MIAVNNVRNRNARCFISFSKCSEPPWTVDVIFVNCYLESENRFFVAILSEIGIRSADLCRKCNDWHYFGAELGADLGTAVDCQATACQMPLRFKNVPVFK